ncbi:septum formation initiator family protein [Candidatus Acetothermia bacterium]|jgi:cell division protein FtsB/cell division protein DivIC|nr:septum formation initiator family protein [Candidatus Acetothermia bacterium]MCI2426494.1 septum formation initiator family protein [Candidatus Acetothermia bacterium]MCI2426933.1 septum formation initiator family protein [Candidatus Acetothermia bacterium]MCI2428888.1 septum formation initiator family protein [Candidatus Acetothermia bacterium]
MERYQAYPAGLQSKRRRFSGIWRIRVIGITALLLSLLLVYGGRFIHIQRAGRLLAAQQERQIDALMRNRALQESLMKRDCPEYIEYLARKRLGLVKPGEIKVIFINE